MKRPPIKRWFRTYTDFFGRIKTWQRFAREVRSLRKPLLLDLKKYNGSILVAGCQRSGTTAVSRLITKSEGMTNFWSRKDEELDAGVILAGLEPLDINKRYCFQTTYLNERYIEYFDQKNSFQLIWVLRNPSSVVYSLLHNWEKFAFDELFESCGRPWFEKNKGSIKFAIEDDVVKACCSYNAKLDQLTKIYKGLPTEKLFVIDYDKMVTDRRGTLSSLYNFIGIDFKEQYIDMINNKSVNKALFLNEAETNIIKQMSHDAYTQVSNRYSGGSNF